MDIIQQLLKLVKINTRISSLHSSDEILAEIMNGAMALTGTSSAFILRVAPDRAVGCVARYEAEEAGLRTQWSSSSALEAFDAGRLAYSTRAQESSKAPSIVLGNLQTVISVPLAPEPDGTVMLQLVGQDTTSIDPQTLSLLNLFVSQVQVTASKTRLEELALRNAALAATGELAAQVAHDIRAPLAALEALSAELSRLPGDKRDLVLGAVGRIREIARTLSEKGEGAFPQPLAGLVEALVTEKRAQYLSRPGLRLECSAEPALTARVQAAELKRLLSNLVDNAVEALGDRGGTVKVALSARDGQVALSVEDDGKGIPADVLARLGRRGETHGKNGGSGLGLYHARTTAEAWGGSLSLVSEAGKGAMVCVLLPSSSAEAVLIDDDALARKTWELAARRAGRKLRTFAAVADFLAAAGSIDRAAAVYLDSDLGNGLKGEVEAARLRALGFREIYLATGHPPERFADVPHLRGVVGKTPPF